MEYAPKGELYKTLSSEERFDEPTSSNVSNFSVHMYKQFTQSIQFVIIILYLIVCSLVSTNSLSKHITHDQDSESQNPL